MGLKNAFVSLLDLVHFRISRDLRETYPEWELTGFDFSSLDWFESVGSHRPGVMARGRVFFRSLSDEVSE